MQKINWHHFWKTFLLVAISFGVLIYVVILAVDPYDIIFFSPPLARAPVDGNQRFSYPAIARKQDFDSAIFGTSTTRMLNPDDFDYLFGSQFANLSMNNAMAYEQTEIFKLFNRHHPQATTLIFGIDVVWCTVEETYEKYSDHLFPEWMYDDNRFNDLLYLFNVRALEVAIREIRYLMGLHKARWNKNGYKTLYPDKEYNLERAREKLYGKDGENASIPKGPRENPTLEERASWHFATHKLMDQILQAAPTNATKILVFVPYHEHWLLERSARYEECKDRMTQIASQFPNTHVLDFMISSNITREDQNYWDPIHYNKDTASLLAKLIARGIRERKDIPGYLQYLRAN